MVNDSKSELTELNGGGLEVPGCGRPLDWAPDWTKAFPTVVGSEYDDWAAATLTIREVCMLRVVEELTNKPEWWTKVHDPVISERWKNEALGMDWLAYRNFADFTPAMADACIAELRVKADMYEKTGLIPVMDYSAAVLKSDKLITDDLRDALNKAIAALENVPDDQKDWHPNSDDKVLNLVHPSLWPLVYGRTRALTERRVGVANCLEFCGAGQVVAEPAPINKDVVPLGRKESINKSVLSTEYQWLPCDVVLEGGQAKVDSYINNMHPVKHAELYPVVEQFIEKALPAWDIVYRWPKEFRTQRLVAKSAGYNCFTPDVCKEISQYECRRTNRPLDQDEAPREEREEYEDGYESGDRGTRDRGWWSRTHPVKLPDPVGVDFLKVGASHVKTSGFFNSASRIQVIVKLANIHLTPDKPSYDGGSWHVEGLLNEHICATALFYYDSDNITDCHLGLRAPANAEDLVMELDHEQGDFDSIERTFDINVGGDTVLQTVGSVLTRPGRTIFFPNLFQHRVSPFELADPSRAGHRKILALFLVDPAIPVLSTANVPPQQRSWWREATRLDSSSLRGLPREMMEMVLDNIDFPFDEDEAKAIRREIMRERAHGSYGEPQDGRGWDFCEH